MDMQLKFLGATQNVTGSSYFLEVNSKKILVDCGLYQEREFRARNWNPFPVNPHKIDLVLLTHAHLDHCGLLPKLVREGFKGKILCTPPTQDIAKIVLLDAAHIQEEDAQFKRKRHQREGRKGPYPEVPLYREEDVREVFPLFESVEYEKTVNITDSLSVTFYEAGHILGSSMIKIKVKSGGTTRTILFSGDVGRWDKPITRDPTLFDQADYILVESTYGDRFHEDVSDIKSMICKVINSTDEKNGNVIIPTFAVERAQELLYYLSELLQEDRIPHLLTFVDSPMAIQVTEVFQQHKNYFDQQTLKRLYSGDTPFYFSTLRLTRSVEESKAINHIKGSCIIIAGSGMCTGGRIKHHLVNNISRAESSLLFIGYQARGTLGREILEKPKNVRIHGQVYPVKANIIQINGFSAHADQGELLKWLSGLQSSPRKVFVTHGEKEVAFKFADILREKFNWNVVIPEYLDEFYLN